MYTFITVAFIMLFIISHWLSDFVLQTDWEATNKSSNNKALLKHTSKYSLVVSILIGLFTFMSSYQILLFMLVTFLCHTLTDYYTSRLNTKLWKAGKVHYFFVSIGFDQVLHYFQLFLTYFLITN